MKMKSILFSALLITSFGCELFAKNLIAEKDPIELDFNDPKTIIANYIKAVGGEAKVKSIKNASLTAEANFQGQTIQIKTITDSENIRMMQSTAVGGNVMQKTLYVGGKAQMIMMGQVQELPDETAEMLKPQTYVFPELYYEEMGYKLQLEGTEEINGEQANKLVITASNGMITTEYYSVASGLKLRTSSDAAGDISYSDYQTVDGVKFPMLLTIKNPMLPTALEAKIVSININQSLSDSDFQ